MPSQADVEQFQNDLNLLTAAAVAEATRVAASVATDPVDKMEAVLVAAIPVLLQKYITAAAQLATVFYQRSGPGGSSAHAGGLAQPAGAGTFITPGSRVAARPAGRSTTRPMPAPRAQPSAPESTLLRRGQLIGATDRRSIAAAEAFQPRPADPPPRAQIESSVRWSIRPARDPEGAGDSTVTSRLAGMVQRHVANAARDTISENADLEGAKYARQARPDACAFCRLLATRGPDYLTEQSAQFVVGRRAKSRGGRPGELTGKQRGSRAIGELYHDDCHCVPVPVRPGETYTPPEYAQGWTDQYMRAAAMSNGGTKSILAQMRKLSPDNKK